MITIRQTARLRNKIILLRIKLANFGRYRRNEVHITFGPPSWNANTDANNTIYYFLVLAFSIWFRRKFHSTNGAQIEWKLKIMHTYAFSSHQLRVPNDFKLIRCSLLLPAHIANDERCSAECPKTSAACWQKRVEYWIFSIRIGISFKVIFNLINSHAKEFVYDSIVADTLTRCCVHIFWHRL